MKKAIFLDKDGTLIPDIPYNVDPSLISLNSGVGEGLSILKSLNYKLIVVSNQAGIALDYFKEKEVGKVWNKINELLILYKIKIDAFYFCPHYLNGTVPEYSIACNCRKPLSGLIDKAANDFNIDIAKSWMIGDILNDVEAGNRAGCKTILIDNGNETEWIKSEIREPGFVAVDFLDAANYIASATKTEFDFNGKVLAGL